MKKIIFSVASLAILFASCSDDDDSSTPSVVDTEVTAAVITGGPYSFCVGDGEEDIANVIVSDAGSGANSTFIITDEDGLILGLPPAVSNFPDFDTQGAGVCLIWHINYADGLEGLEVGSLTGDSAANLIGDKAIAGPITINRTEDCTLEAAVLSGGPYDFCVGDGLADNITDDVVDDAGFGNLSSFVVTDADKNILGLPGMVGGPDFDGAGVGNCYVYHINYKEGLVGLTGPDAEGVSTANLDDLVGDFELSNFLMVNRTDCAPAVVAATLEAGASATDGEYIFIVDGTADNVTDLIVFDEGAGETGQIVVTDADGWILGLPPVFEAPNFDDAGVGVCYIRHINYDGDITGLTGPDEVGTPTANVNDLEGEFKLSNIIVVNRVTAL